MAYLETKSFDEVFNFTRPTSKWVFNQEGQLVEVPAGQPAFEYDPVTGEPKGILIEEASTNLFPNNVTKEGVGSPSYDKSIVGQYSGMDIARFTSNVSGGFTGTGNNGVSIGSITVNEDSIHTVSGIMRQGNTPCVSFGSRSSPQAGFVKYNFDLNQIEFQGPDVIDSYFEKITDGVVYLKVSYLTTSTTNIVRFAPTSSGNDQGIISVGDFVDVIFLQLEQGSFATSPIITNGTAVTRTADTVARTLGAEWNPSEGTLIFEVSNPLVDGTFPFFYVGNGSTGTNSGYFNVIILNQVVRVNRRRNSDDSYAGQNIGTALSRNRIALSYVLPTNTLMVSLNGAQPAVVSDTQLIVPTLLLLGRFENVGGSEAIRLNGTIKSVIYKPRAVSDAELQELSTL